MEELKKEQQAEQETSESGFGKIGVYQSRLTKEERIESAKRAGKASGEARRRARERRTFQEDLLILLSQPVPPSIRKKNNIEGGTWQQAVLLGALKAASKGNTKGLEVISALIGEKPKEELVIETREKDGFEQAMEQLLDGNAELNESKE